ERSFELKYERQSHLEENLYHKILDSANKEILTTIFSANKRSLEALGQGVVSLAEPSLDEEWNEFINSAIRILGESRRIQGLSTYQKGSLPKSLWSYMRK